MREKVYTHTALDSIKEISRFIAEGYRFSGDIDAADRYLSSVFDVFENLSETSTPAMADEDNLPEYVRKVTVPGFRGYFLHIAYMPEQFVLLGAFRPGLTNEQKYRRTYQGISEIQK